MYILKLVVCPTYVNTEFVHRNPQETVHKKSILDIHTHYSVCLRWSWDCAWCLSDTFPGV